MKKTIPLLLFFFSLTNIGIAQAKAEKQVAQAIATWQKAMVDGDKNLLATVLAEELEYVHSGGKLESKAMLLESIGSGKSDFITMDLTEQTIKIVGKTAIVRHKLAGDTNDGGKAAKVKLFVMQIWQKQGRKWKLMARQAAKQP